VLGLRLVLRNLEESFPWTSWVAALFLLPPAIWYYSPKPLEYLLRSLDKIDVVSCTGDAFCLQWVPAYIAKGKVDPFIRYGKMELQKLLDYKSGESLQCAKLVFPLDLSAFQGPGSATRWLIVSGSHGKSSSRGHCLLQFRRKSWRLLCHDGFNYPSAPWIYQRRIL